MYQSQGGFVLGVCLVWIVGWYRMSDFGGLKSDERDGWRLKNGLIRIHNEPIISITSIIGSV